MVNMGNDARSRPLVLVADDDPEFCKAIGRLLEGMNLRLEYAHSGQQALLALETLNAQLLLLDVGLPDMSGYEILQKISGGSRWRNPQTLVITGMDSIDLAVKCIQLGAQDYITKPFDPTLLIARVNSCLERSSFMIRERAYLETIKEQNAVLAKRESFFRGMVEDQTELICRFDSDLRLTFVNAAFCNYLALPAERLYGMRAPVFSGEEQKTVVMKFLSSLTPDNPTMEMDAPLATPGGGTRWLHWTVRSLGAAEGGKPEYQAVGRDVTGRRLMENALIESERNLNKAQQIAGFGYISWMSGSRSQVWSDQVFKIFGLEPGAIRPSREKLLEMVDPAEREMVGGTLISSSETMKGFNIEFRAVKPDGESIFVNLHGEAVEDPDTGGARVEAVIQDISKRKRAERALIIEKEKAEAATPMKDKFISLVSHDIRAPMGAVLGLLELVEEGAMPRDKERDFVHRAYDNCQKLLRMVDNLLNLNSLRSGVLLPEIADVNVRELVESAWDKLRYLASRKDVTMECEINPAAVIKADPELAAQVVGNILHNAAKFSFKGGVIGVFQPPGEGDVIAFRDHGMGIDTSTQARLFSHDSRVSGQGTAGERGSGLGMPLSHDIMAAHGGSITVESAPGSGALFKICFPKAIPTLLIVDDDEDFRLLIRSGLEDLKVKIIEAGGGEGAIEAAMREPVSLVITDYDMPGMNGVELVDWIRKESKDREIPVIMVSVDADYKTKIKALKFGVSDFLIKPVEKSALLEAVRRHVKTV